MQDLQQTDILIIGAGIIGISIARELAKYDVSVTVIDREADVGMGISKTSGSLIYMGLFQAMSLVIKDLGRGADLERETKTERMRMLWEGFSSFDRFAHELDIEHKHAGLLIIARNSEELKKLEALEHLVKFVPGGTVRRVDREEIIQIEPNITPDAVAGLHDATGTISIFGPEYVFALYENAAANGVRVLLETECKKIHKEEDHQVVWTNNGPIRARFVVNCAGKYADQVADMAGARTGWKLVFYRSQALILDKKLKGTIANIIGIPPGAGKIDLLYPQAEGTIHVYGSNYDFIENRDFTETTKENYDDAIRRMKALVPSLSEEHIITSYVGVRTFNDKEFDENLIEFAPNNANFINVLVRMPGFTPASSIAVKVARMMASRGLSLAEKKNFNPNRISIPRFRFLNDADRNRLISRDARYGRVICRCESVTEGEIVEAVRRGARTVQGVMFRTRAGMGRCQRNWCGPKILDIISRELGVNGSNVMFKGKGFHMLAN